MTALRSEICGFIVKLRKDGLGSTELSLLNGNSFLDEETWHFFDTFVHTHSNDFHRHSSTCWGEQIGRGSSLRRLEVTNV